MDSNGLPISIIIGPANNHDSTKFIGVMESISDHLDDDDDDDDDDVIEQIVSVYADKSYDSKIIRKYLKNRNIADCIPYRNYKIKCERTTHHHTNYNKTRYVVERFFAWMKNGFHRTRIRYERYAENYLGFVYLASIMMYWRVLG